MFFDNYSKIIKFKKCQIETVWVNWQMYKNEEEKNAYTFLEIP